MTIIYFIFILGITIFIHELGHFLFAKKFGVYCYEFSLGMGPKIFSFRRKNDETEYCIKLFPIGGSVKMAGEEVEEDRDIPTKGRMQSKTLLQRLIIIVAGAVFNFLLGIVVLFIIGLIYGAPETKPFVGRVDKEYNSYKLGIREGDLILKTNGKKVSTIDDVLMQLELIKKGDPIEFELKDTNSKVRNVTVSPTKEKVEGGYTYIYGFGLSTEKHHGIGYALKYSVDKFISVFRSMFSVISNLITGRLGISNLAGPVGIYNIVGEQAKVGFENVLFLITLICINVGFVNLLPFPAFDGGRVIFLAIEKITRKPIDSRVENIIHTVGFALLMLLMIVITIQDIKNVIK